MVGQPREASYREDFAFCAWLQLLLTDPVKFTKAGCWVWTPSDPVVENTKHLAKCVVVLYSQNSRGRRASVNSRTT